MPAPSSDTAAIRQVIRALKAADYPLVHVYDGEEEIEVTTETEAIDAITAVDDAYLYVRTPNRGILGWVRFVMGNDPEEVVCNHTTNLSPVIDPVTKAWWS